MKSNIQKLLASLPLEIVQHIQHLERMRQDFVANVSHELRTPLTVIHGYLETLLDQTKPEDPLKKIFSQMQQQTLRMENLIENLLLLSQLETHEPELKMEKLVDVSNLLETIQQDAIALSGEANHSIKVEADADLRLRAYPEELRSLFSNIIFNAVKYTPARGEILIEWHLKNNQAYFSVKDTGIGIAAEHIPRLTERFYRIDPARSRKSGGTGLGLAIAKHILMRHEAELKISSEPGKGSTFVCIFPKKRIVHPRITT
jgi:two-component system phosphate regulon sensor histidine kinase PhoR